jgi:hypothetical protein
LFNLFCFSNSKSFCKFCEESGKEYVTLIGEDGSEKGYCNVFGVLVDGWEYYRERKSKEINNRVYSSDNKKSLNKISYPFEDSKENKEKQISLNNSQEYSFLALSPPSSFDWRNYNGQDWTTEIRDQGSCGSCWAFSSLAVIESKIDINLNNSSFNKDLSEQDVITNNPYGGSCDGGYETDALNYTKNIGLLVNLVCLITLLILEVCVKKEILKKLK